jgi:Pyruvate/2-oxoacid:ferredoxin oxidoreductase gamma subunit
MLGALMAVGDIPLTEASLQKAIETKTKKAFVEANSRCFEQGMIEKYEKRGHHWGGRAFSPFTMRFARGIRWLP